MRRRDVAGVVRSPAATAVEVPADVADHDIGEVVGEPRRVDEGPEGRACLHAGNLRAVAVVEPLSASRICPPPLRPPPEMITPDTAELFFALLTLVANAAVLAGVGLWIAARWSKGAAVALDDVRVELARFGVPLAFAVAATAMLGSLYFSEVANFVPCTLCWFQRIGMYSLAIILFVAIVAPRPQHQGLRHHTGARRPPDLHLPLPGRVVPEPRDRRVLDRPLVLDRLVPQPRVHEPRLHGRAPHSP